MAGNVDHAPAQGNGIPKIFFTPEINDTGKTLCIHEHDFDEGLTQVHKTASGNAAHPCVTLLLKYKGQVLQRPFSFPRK
jgi:hypothetical protein